MRKWIVATIVMATGLATVAAQGPSPPNPASPLPPPAPAFAAPPPTENEPEEAASGPQITLGEKQETITPGVTADGFAEGGAVEVKTENPGELTVLMKGFTAAHCRLGCLSSGIQVFRLVQEFDVAGAGPGETSVNLDLAAALKGYIRSRHNASACVRVAGVAVYPAGGSSPLMAIGFPPACVADGRCYRFDLEQTAPSASGLASGRYVLVADFVTEATAEGLVNGRGVADFSPDDVPEGWAQVNDPFKEVERDDFGFLITVKATPISPALQARRPGFRQAQASPSARTPGL